MAREWQPVSEVLERSGEREKGVFGGLLLLEGRTAHGSERAAARGDWGDSDRVRRSRIRLLDNTSREGTKSERADFRRLLARRSRGHDHPGRERRSATRGVDRRAVKKLEIHHHHLTSVTTQAKA